MNDTELTTNVELVENSLSELEQLSYMETLAAYNLISSNLQFYTKTDKLMNISNIVNRLYSEVITTKKAILTSNAVILSLPSVKEVEAPGYFEAAMRNTELLLDSTLSPIVNAATSLLTGTIEAVGKGISSIFSSPLSLIGIFTFIAGFVIVSSINKGSHNQDPNIELKGNNKTNYDYGTDLKYNTKSSINKEI